MDASFPSQWQRKMSVCFPSLRVLRRTNRMDACVSRFASHATSTNVTHSLNLQGVRQSYPAPCKGQFQGDDLDDPSLAFAAVHIAKLLQLQRENVTEKCMGVEQTVHVRLLVHSMHRREVGCCTGLVTHRVDGVPCAQVQLYRQENMNST